MVSRELAGSRVLVTGGAGFLGSYVCEALVERGAAVVCVDNESTGAAHNLDGIPGNADLEYLRQDVSDGIDVDGQIDVVLHLASIASPVKYLENPVETLRVGSSGTFHALEVARKHGARFVLASTSEVYGDPAVNPQPETYWGNVNPIGPRSVYDESKRFSEAATTAYCSAYGVDTGIVRIFNTYGPRMSIGDGRVVPAFVGQALRGEPLTVAGRGTQTRSLCFVSDTVRGLLAMAGGDRQGPINIGNPHEITVLELAEQVLRATGSSSELRFVDLPEDDPQVRCPEIDRARRQLDWEPLVSLEDGIASTVAWYRDLLRSTDSTTAHSSSRA